MAMLGVLSRELLPRWREDNLKRIQNHAKIRPESEKERFDGHLETGCLFKRLGLESVADL